MAINYQKLAEQVSRDYHSYPGLIGILWIGSAAFGIKDSLSDIDIRLLVDRRRKLKPMKQITQKSIQIEIDEMSWHWLTENLTIDSDQRWIREKSVILFDPKQVITEKFEQLKRQMQQETKNRLWQYFKDAFYSHEIDKCLKRRDRETASLYFYKSVDSILKFIFLYHNQPVTPFKWRWHFLTKGKLLPSQTIEQLQEIILSTKSASAKLKILNSIETQLQQLMVRKGYKKEQVKEHWRF